MKLSLLLLLLVALADFAKADVRIVTTSLPNGIVQNQYLAVIKTDSGCTPFKWSVVSGALPPGVRKTESRSTRSLFLTGTVTTAANYFFTIAVEGCGGYVSQTSYKVKIQSAAHHTVDLSWTASQSKGVIGYNVYRGPDGATWGKINASVVGSTLYDDSSVANGSTYYYAITAVDTAGNESDKTAIVKAGIP